MHGFLRIVKSILVNIWSIYKLKFTGKTTFNDHLKFQFPTGKFLTKEPSLSCIINDNNIILL